MAGPFAHSACWLTGPHWSHDISQSVQTHRSNNMLTTAHANGQAKASHTPDNVAIKPQRMGFEFDEKVPRYWLDNNYLISHTMNALSVLFPEGEQFFVDSVRAFRDQIRSEERRVGKECIIRWSAYY